MEVSNIPPLIPTKYKYHGVVSFVHRDQFYGFVEVNNPGSINNSNSPTVLHFRPFLVMRSEERRYLRVGTNVLRVRESKLKSYSRLIYLDRSRKKIESIVVTA